MTVRTEKQAALLLFPDVKQDVNICLFQRLDPRSSSDPPHPADCGKVASSPGRRSHPGQALAASAHFRGHRGRYPGVYQRDAVGHQVEVERFFFQFDHKSETFVLKAIFFLFHALPRESSPQLVHIILAVWTWSMLQFPLHLAGQCAELRSVLLMKPLQLRPNCL